MIKVKATLLFYPLDKIRLFDEPTFSYGFDYTRRKHARQAILILEE